MACKMSTQCGLVGLPNVGKSTLFNALSGSSATVANYPFSTIKPLRATVPVPDVRLTRLARVTGSERTIPATIEFVDIAGLVAGASRGEGLGNAFLAQIRDVDAIVHVVRCFEDVSTTHVEGSLSPERDVEIVTTEMLLKDLETANRSMEKVARRVKTGDKKALAALSFHEKLAEHLECGNSARSLQTSSRADQALLSSLRLLTQKPILYVANVSEQDLPVGNALSQNVISFAGEQDALGLVVCADLEAQLWAFSREERLEFLQAAGVAEPSLSTLIRASYEIQRLITFFTYTNKETRCWTVKDGTPAYKAAGQIHSDFERGFIRAETIAVEKLVAYGSDSAARQDGAVRSEGREYGVCDGDVILFRFNV